MSLSGGMDNIARALSGLASSAGCVGDSGNYYCKNDSGYTVYFFWNAADIALDGSFGMQNDFEECNITMPKCSGVSGNEPSPGDMISTNSTYWSVLSVKKLGLPMNPAAYQLRIRKEPEANRVP